MSEKQNVYVVLEDRNIERSMVHSVFDNRDAAKEFIENNDDHLGELLIEYRELRSETADASQMKLGQ
jgi:hypothetical protein